MSGPVKWIVVENAGYEGERDVHTAATMYDAYYWLQASYSCLEVTELHVDICQEDSNGEREY